MDDRELQYLLLFGTQTGDGLRGLRCLDRGLYFTVVAAAGFREDVFERIGCEPSAHVSDTIYYPASGDHRYKRCLGRLFRVESLGVLPNIDKDLLNDILGIVRVPQHASGKRPDEAAVCVQTVLDGSCVTVRNSF